MTGAVVVGWGVLSPSGYGAEAQTSAARTNGRVPVSQTIDDFDVAGYLRLRGLRPLSRASLLGCVAAAAALGHPADPPGDADRRGVVLGTRWASLEPLFAFEQSAARDGPSLVNPAQFPNVVVNVHAGYLGILFGLAGPNMTVCGPGAGLEAVGRAADLLELDRADYVLAGGIEALGEPLLRGLERTGSEPAGEAAAFLLLARGDAGGGGSARVASFASVSQSRREELLDETLSLAGLEPEDVAALLIAGRPPELRGIVAASLVAGGSGGAAGAVAAVAAAHAVAETGSPAVAACFPSEGTQSAVALVPL